MTNDQLLDRLTTIERDRLAHAELAERLLMERDGLIYEALKATSGTRSGGPMGLAGAIAERLRIDRSWPYRIRDEYPGRYRRWMIKQATDSLATQLNDPTEISRVVDQAKAAAAEHIKALEDKAAKVEEQKEKRRERDRRRRKRQQEEAAGALTLDTQENYPDAD